MKQQTEQAPKHLKSATKKWWLAVMADYQLEPHHVPLVRQVPGHADQDRDAEVHRDGPR